METINFPLPHFFFPFQAFLHYLIVLQYPKQFWVLMDSVTLSIPNPSYGTVLAHPTRKNPLVKILFYRSESATSSLWGQQKRLGHFLSKAKHELEFSLALKFEHFQSDFIGLPVANNTFWQDIHLCPTSWNSQADANVLCRSLGHFGGGLPR